MLRGAFELEVAERVAGGEPLAPEAIAGLLASLAGKSLVQIQAGVMIGYSLLETVRQFAGGRLAASGEETPVQVRLLEWALEVARSAEAARPGAQRQDWSSRLSAGQASIRAALSWALGRAAPARRRSARCLAPGRRGWTVPARRLRPGNTGLAATPRPAQNGAGPAE